MFPLDLTANPIWHDAVTVGAFAVFALTYLFIAVGKLPGYHIDRAGAALLGASLMVWLGVLSLEEAYSAIDFNTITLLLGMMADATGYVLLALAVQRWMVVPILFLLAAGGVGMPALQAVLSKSVDSVGLATPAVPVSVTFGSGMSGSGVGTGVGVTYVAPRAVATPFNSAKVAEYARLTGMAIEGARVAVQGFGNVGGTAGKLFAEAGAKVVAVQDHTGSIHNAKGLDVPALLAHVQQTGGVGGFAGADAMANDEFWGVACDILIPAALESQITQDNAGKIQAKMVIEGANGPTTPEADDILNDKGVLVLPDVIANAGGVTVSYFEWVQDFSSFFWTEEEINARLVRIMKEAFAGVWQVAQDNKVSLRTATFIVACKRMLHAREMRGLYP